MPEPSRALTLILALLFATLAPGCGGDDDPAAPGPEADPVSPAAVSDLRIESVDGSNVTVAWTAPGDDADEGTAAEYSIRISPNPITEGTWPTDSELPAPPDPKVAGTMQTAVIDASGMADLYVALRARDEADNLSPISNVVHHSFSSGFVIHQLTHSGNNRFPCVNDGVITWVKYVPGSGDEIYMRDLTNTIGLITRVTGDGGEKKSPSNAGLGLVVWQGRSSPETDWEIFFDTNLLGDLTPTQYTDNTMSDTAPAVTGSGAFVWLQGDAMFGSIMRHTLGLGAPASISEVSTPVAEYSCDAPAADGGDVVWRAFHRGTLEYKASLYEGFTGLTYDITDDVNAAIATRFSLSDGDLAYEYGEDVAYWNGSAVQILAEGQTPSLDEGRVAYVVWDPRQGDYEIHYWDGSTIHAITDNDYHDSQPSLHGDLLVWAGKTDGVAWQIFYVRL
jgi:hypothetical protein